MKRNIKYNIVAGWALALVAMFASYGCTDKWNDHYDANPSAITDKTLWDVISSNTSLTQFTEILKLTGYDKILSASRVYTVWAPANGTFNADSIKALIAAGTTQKENVILEFVENHIADYSYSATGIMDKKVEMLNKKIIEFTSANATEFGFQNVTLSTRNIPASNGLLHILAHSTAYSTNLWEYLAKSSDLDSIKSFLYSYDVIKFDENASVQGPIVNGAITYLDSVVTNTNTWFSRIGRLNDEDSSYVFFAPTNEVWAEVLAKTKSYYQYAPSKTASVQHVRDSLSNYYSKYAIIKNLVFSKTVNNFSADSIISTTHTKFGLKGNSAPKQALYNNCTGPYTLSNGDLYIAHSFNYRSIINWHDTIKVEAENATGRTFASCTLDSRRVTTSTKQDTIKGTVSANQFVECTPLTSTGSPSVTFTIPKVLSAAYRIKVVFVPANITSKNMLPSLLQKGKVRFQLKNTDAKGSLVTGINLSGQVVSPYQLDTVLVRSIDAVTKDTLDTYTFPTCEYGFETADVTTTLTVITDVKRTEKDFDRILRIDCIILEPVEK